MNNVNTANIPDEMKAIPQWVPWRFEAKPGDKKPRKMPKLWNDNGNAASNNPDTWTTFDNAMQSYTMRAYDGVAFMLHDTDPYTMFDEDDCIGADGLLIPRAMETVEKFNTYTEISVSGNGLKGITRGKFPAKMKGKKVGDQEIYCRLRMFCATGNHFPGTPRTINANQTAVDWFYKKLAGEKKSPDHRRNSGGDEIPTDQDALAERCRKYIQKCPDAISGEGGHNATFRVACECFRFALDYEHAREVMDGFNADKTSGEQWADEEIEHKLASAKDEVIAAGEFGIRVKETVVDKKDPLPLARRFLVSHFSHPEHPTLLYADGEHWQFNGSCWEIVKQDAIRQQLYQFVEPFKVLVVRGENESHQPFKPTGRDIDNITDALRAVTYTRSTSPSWLGQDAWAQPDLAKLPIVAASNGVFDLTGGVLKKISNPTPRLFTTTALDYDLIENPCPPLAWLEFLADIFEGDQQQIELLQEWCGYCMTLLTRMQKILLLIGPPRSGKGTIARVLTSVVGAANVVAPTLAGLGSHFGLWALVGKGLAIVSDARLSGRTDQAVVTERLLSISGEDSLTIDRKNRELLTIKLATRLMILSNELPRLADASGALPSRLVILRLRKTYLGNEDTGLTDRLVEERKGIAAWAMEGLARLTEEWRFTSPAAADELRDELGDLAAPIKAFITDWCHIDKRVEVEAYELFAAWCAWCEEQGDTRPGTQQVFGRDLRAAVPSLDMRQPRDAGKRVRVYLGIGLTDQAQVSAQKWRLARDGTRSHPMHVRREE